MTRLAFLIVAIQHALEQASKLTCSSREPTQRTKAMESGIVISLGLQSSPPEQPFADNKRSAVNNVTIFLDFP